MFFVKIGDYDFHVVLMANGEGSLKEKVEDEFEKGWRRDGSRKVF